MLATRIKIMQPSRFRPARFKPSRF